MIPNELMITAAGHVAAYIALHPESKSTVLKYYPGVDLTMLPKYGDLIATMVELIDAGAQTSSALSIALYEKNTKDNHFLADYMKVTADFVGTITAIDHARYLAYKIQRAILSQALSEGKEPSELRDAISTIQAIEHALPDPLTIEQQLPAVIDRLITPGDFMIPNPMKFATPRINFLYRGGYHLIASRPGGGKTSILVQLARGLSIELRKVFFASYEMELTDFIARLLLLEPNDLTSDDIYFRPNDAAPLIWNNMGAIEKITKRMTFVDNPGDIDTLITMIRASEPDVVILDYLQLVPPSKSTRRAIREQQISDMSRKLKNLALELKVPIIIASQLNRDATGEPILAHLRESGSLEQDADTVTFFWNTDDANYKNAKTAKNRRGALGKEIVPWVGPKMMFIRQHESDAEESWLPF